MQPRTPYIPEPTAAALLRSLAPEVVEHWRALALEQVEAARKQSPEDLVDNLPTFLDRLAQVLASGWMAEDVERLFEASKAHAEQRTHLPGYTVPQVIREYGLLRQVLITGLRTAGHLEHATFVMVHTALDHAIEQAADHFVVISQRERGELQAIADAALTQQSLEELLPMLVDAVAEALRADTVAFLLRDQEDLVVRAGRGLDTDVEQGSRVPMGQGFAGRVAEARALLVEEEVDPAGLVSPALREAQVRSLLGAPLLIGNELLGVLHIGSLTPRRFSPHERRLMRVVAARAALALDRAQLLGQLERENQRQSDFIATLSHEVRTPLSVMSNALYILESMELADPRADRQLLAMERQLRLLTRLTDDLLDVSRIARGKLELRLELVNLTQLLEEVAEAVRPMADSKSLEFSYALGPDTLCVQGDTARLTQVATNLLNNAIRYTPPGGKIHLGVSREGDCARVIVRDTGIGIPPSLQPQIFDMFRQLATPMRQQREGLGIGLNLVKNLVEMHRGSITASSRGEGQGAEFVVSLPLHSAS